jgi:hypothetical protein
VGIDRIHDAEGDDVPSAMDSAHPADAARAPGLDTRYERAVGELAAENAELYKRVEYLERQIANDKDRFAAWGREMAWREEVMKARLERLEHAVTELSVAEGPHGRRVDRTDSFVGEKSQQETRRGGAASEITAAGAAVGNLANVIGAAVGSTVSADVGGIAGGVLGGFAAGIALVRKLREDRRDDRSQG